MVNSNQSEIAQLQEEMATLSKQMEELAKFAVPYGYDEEKAKMYYKAQRRFNEVRAKLNKLH